MCKIKSKMNPIYLILLYLRLISSQLFEPSNWMSWLPDQASLSSLSIPGTHDSCANNAAIKSDLRLLFTLEKNDFLQDMWRTQDLNLRKQLQVGIRFMDMRCRHVNNRFQMYHGPINLNLEFAQALDVISHFLFDFPRETVLVRVREEWTPVSCNRTFRETLSAYLDKIDHVLFQSVSSLGQARGKLVIIDESIRLDEQDSWKESLDTKKRLIESQLIRCSNYTYRFRLCANWINLAVKGVSAQSPFKEILAFFPSFAVIDLILGFFSFYSTPVANSAKILNDFLLSRLNSSYFYNPRLVVMDYPSDKLVWKIISFNFAK